MNRNFFLLSSFLIAATSVVGIFYLFPLEGVIDQIGPLVFLKNSLVRKNEQSISLIAVGDVMLSRTVARKMKAKNDINYPFLKIQDYLKSVDLVFGNLEGPITKGRDIEADEMIFRGDPGVEVALKNAGFSVVSLANNHTPDFSRTGIHDTLSLLDAADILHTGAGMNETDAYEPAFIDKLGIRFAILAYNDTDVAPPHYAASESRAGTAFMDIERMKQSVHAAGEKADIVIVSMHSGNEYTLHPNRRQKEFAHAAIDAGADLVIGHHPHVVQSAEKYKDKYIFYSLGNFVFDQMWSRETREGLALKIFFDKNGVTKIEPSAIIIEDFSQPRMADEKEKEIIFQRLGISF